MLYIYQIPQDKFLDAIFHVDNDVHREFLQLRVETAELTVERVEREKVPWVLIPGDADLSFSSFSFIYFLAHNRKACLESFPLLVVHIVKAC